jgi:hypothetical protein
MAEMGRGVGFRYEVLEFTDNMTVADLMRQLEKLPPTAKLEMLFKALRDGSYRTESIDKKALRVPIEVARGSLIYSENA